VTWEEEVTCEEEEEEEVTCEEEEEVTCEEEEEEEVTCEEEEAACSLVVGSTPEIKIKKGK